MAVALAAGAVGCVAFAWRRRAKRSQAPQITEAHARALVWDSISGALSASQLFIGDHLGIYSVMRDLSSGGASWTVIDLSQRTELHARWLREWCAQQAAMGILRLEDGDGDSDSQLRYHLPAAFGEVLANRASPHYDISMVQLVPSLVWRAQNNAPAWFKSGIGASYDNVDVTDAIDRQHLVQIRTCLIPKVIPAVPDVQEALERGVAVAELGCGGGNMLIELAKHFPRCTFHGYEVSDPALMRAASAVAAAGLSNVRIHDGRLQPLGEAAERYPVVLTLDVLHDASHPTELIKQVRQRISPNGVWLLADVKCEHGIRNNVKKNPAAKTMFAFSVTLCMSCALSEKGGAGLGTLGFSIPVARRMLQDGGFRDTRVLLEDGNTRWFEVRP